MWVARINYHNTKRFFFDILNKDEELARCVNNLFRTSFYLFNFAFAALTLGFWGDLKSVEEMIVLLSAKTGAFVIFLGCMHFFHLYLFFRQRRKIQPVIKIQDPSE